MISIGTNPKLDTVVRQSVLQRITARLAATPELIPLLLLVLTTAGFAVASPAFISADNLSNMWAYIPELGIMALAMTILLTAGEFDLSVGAVFAFGPLVTFMLVNQHKIATPLGILIGLIVSMFVGLINGLLVTKVGISSFLVTLGMTLTVRGFSLFISSGYPQDTTSATGFLQTFFTGTISIGSFTTHAGIFWFLGLALLLHLILKNTRFGNSVMGTGGNVKAAQARGINTDAVKIRLFIFTSAFAFLAGLISAIRIGSASPIAGNGYELEVIAMAVVGGTSLFGGKGTIIGTVIGVVLLRSIRNGIIIVGVAGLAYDMFVGLIILLAMSLQAYIQKKGVR